MHMIAVVECLKPISLVTPASQWRWVFFYGLKIFECVCQGREAVIQ